MIDLICLIFIFLGITLLILGNINIRRNKNTVTKKDDDYNFCVLIPARDESKVIEGLLKSLELSVNMHDVYVIVEDMKDKTVDICNKYQANVILRTTKRQRKGYALDEAIKQIKDYNLYFIFDADNIVDKNFFKEMKKTYEQGYDIGVGYRNCKNGNDNIISACSSLTFSMINTLGNDFRNKHNANIIISGTGFYIRGSWIKKWQGYPFHTLTEDYELSLYSILNNMTSYYNDKAIFYDEQPTKFNQTIKQRVRWIKGYFESRKKYIPLILKDLKQPNYGSKYSVCLGVRAFIYIIIGIVIYMIKNIIILFTNYNVISLISLISIILLSYLIMMIVTYKMIKKDKLDLSRKMKIKTIFYNPIYLTTYVYCALIVLFKKNISWDKIEHKKNNV